MEQKRRHRTRPGSDQRLHPVLCRRNVPQLLRFGAGQSPTVLHWRPRAAVHPPADYLSRATFEGCPSSLNAVLCVQRVQQRTMRTALAGRCCADSACTDPEPRSISSDAWAALDGLSQPGPSRRPDTYRRSLYGQAASRRKRRWRLDKNYFRSHHFDLLFGVAWSITTRRTHSCGHYLRHAQPRGGSK